MAALMVVLAVMAAGAHTMSIAAPALAEQERAAREAEAAAERAVVRNPAAGESLPIPALIGGIVLAFAVGLSAGHVQRRRRTARRLEAQLRPAPTPDPPLAVRTGPMQPAAPIRIAPAPAPPAPPPPEPPRVILPPPPPPAPPPPEPTPAPPLPFRALRPEPDSSTPLGGAPEVPQPETGRPARPEPVRPFGDAPEAIGRRARPAPVADGPARRFARARPWPREAETQWTCEIAWKAGYVKSTFRAMAGPPGADGRRRSIGEAPPLRWTLMTDPEPPTQEMLTNVRALVHALVAAGWERTEPGGAWFAQRFLWRGEGEPGPVEVPEPTESAEPPSR